MTRATVRLWLIAVVAGAALWAFLAGGTPLLAAPPPQTPTGSLPSVGVLIGQVLNRSINQPVPDVVVRLRHWDMEVEQRSQATRADNQGHFRFDNLDMSAHAFYRVEADYQTVTFRSEFVAFQPGVTQTVAALDLFETTDHPDSINVQRLHFIIMAREPGLLSILELYQFANQSDRAYVGTLNAGGQRETVRMALPSGAQDLELQTGTLGVDFVSSLGELAATAPLLPGEKTFDVAFLYLMPYDTPSLSLDRRLHYDTLAVNGLLMDAGARLESEMLTLVGERTAQGQNFLQFNGQNIKAGETLPILLSRLDSIQFGNPLDTSGDAETVATGPLEHAALLYVMLGLGVVIVALGFVYPVLRRQPRPAIVALTEDAGATRQRLLFTLVRLDEAYQAGQISEPAYRRARAHRKAELSALWQRGQDPQ
jgi:hypothetical protein